MAAGPDPTDIDANTHKVLHTASQDKLDVSSNKAMSQPLIIYSTTHILSVHDAHNMLAQNVWHRNINPEIKS